MYDSHRVSVCIYRAARVCVCVPCYSINSLIDGNVCVQATNRSVADISGSVSITLCGVEAPDSAGVPPNVLAVLCL